MADERKKDSGLEILGAAVLLLLLALLCHFHVICPLPTCPEGQVVCQNCPGNCCLPDGSCPCPDGSAPCSLYCPQTSNCPSGCCNIDTCVCTATPACPPHTSWSESRGCCVYTDGLFVGDCAILCSTDPLRIGGCTRGLDACDSGGCCPLGSIGWDSLQSCCIDKEGICVSSCLLNSSLSSCPIPFIGGCDSTGCCPASTFWNGSCCTTNDGFCYGDPCAGVECPEGQICEDGVCTGNLCLGIICPAGLECKDGICINPCANIVCPVDQVCVNGTCINDPCIGVECPADQICINGACKADPCLNVVCTGNTTCINGLCEDLCAGVICPNGLECKDGKCIDPCLNISCPPGFKCENGKCLDPCANMTCPSGKTCIGGVCYNTTLDGNLVDCEYPGFVGACASEIICSSGCVSEIKCVDKRLPADICIGIAGSCNTSSDCCCGYSCQNISGNGVCCPGGLWTCYSE